MTNAIKQFQTITQKMICIVSNDESFRKAFEDDDNFIIFDFLSGFLKLYNKSEAKRVRISEFLSDRIIEGDFDDVIKEYLLDFDMDRGYYAEWHCDSSKIDEICYELLYIEEIDGKYVANITTDIEMSIDITYRDEDTSYHDKEELLLKDFNVVKDKRLNYINLDENTLHEEPDLEYCSECGALLGRTQNEAYLTNTENKILKGKE